ncbi:response regulator transcription factor [Candidatus Gracilibacteria bacterium]|nr:response regulator transcription factor [Candidatus Gracilibacteria bacterium]
MAAPRLIRVLIVDDHPVAQAGVRHLLSALPDFELVGEAASGEEALLLYEHTRPDVVLMDVMMPVMDGITTTARLKASVPNAKVLILSSMGDGEMVQRAMKAGACGYLLKTATAMELAQAVRAAYFGRTTLAPEASQALADSMRTALDVDLTEREREVLLLMTDGMSNIQIAERLTVSPATVKFHISGIFSKLGVSTRAEAIALAYKRKLV